MNWESKQGRETKYFVFSIRHRPLSHLCYVRDAIKKAAFLIFAFNLFHDKTICCVKATCTPQGPPFSYFMFIAVILISGYLAVLVVISIPKQLAEISAARREFTRQLGKPEADNVIRDAISCKLARTYKGNTKTDAAAPKSATTKDEWFAI